MEQEEPTVIDQMLENYDTTVLKDTAGIRETKDTIESIGVEKAKSKVGKSRILIYLYDRSDISFEELKNEINNFQRDDLQIYLVENKIDLLTNSNTNTLEDNLNDYFNKKAKDWLSGKKEDAQLHITNFINDTRKLGLTGGDAREIYTGLVENIANIGQYYVTTSDVNSLDEVDDLIIGLGLSIPYGNNGGNLTQHPEWQEKIEPILENLEDELNEELTQGPKIDKARRRIKLENKLVEVNKLPIETEEQRVIYKQKITELKNNREFSDLNEVFKTNNYLKNK